MPYSDAALLAELTNDPAQLGYAPLLDAGSDLLAADLLNLPRTGIVVPEGGAYEQWRGLVPAYEIINNTVPADWKALVAEEKQRYDTITGAGSVDTNAPNVRSALTAMFPQGSATRTALLDMVKRPGSRAEFLFGLNHVVAAEDVSRVLYPSRYPPEEIP